MNTVVTYYAHPEDWVFKQFVSQDQLERFALDEHLLIVTQKEE